MYSSSAIRKAIKLSIGNYRVMVPKLKLSRLEARGLIHSFIWKTSYWLTSLLLETFVLNSSTKKLQGIWYSLDLQRAPMAKRHSFELRKRPFYSKLCPRPFWPQFVQKSNLRQDSSANLKASMIDQD